MAELESLGRRFFLAGVDIASDETAADGWLRHVAPDVIRARALLDPKLIV
jgi:hypothetical protein